MDTEDRALKCARCPKVGPTDGTYETRVKYDPLTRLDLCDYHWSLERPSPPPDECRGRRRPAT